MHVKKAVARARKLHKSGHEDEDTLTGQVGALLTTIRSRRVLVDGQPWSWRIGYTKLRGRGARSTEKMIGADGILELSIRHAQEDYSKSALFQCKTGNRDLQRLLAQVIALAPFREAAFVIQFGHSAYTAMDWEDALKLALRSPHPDGVSLDEFLSDSFLQCIVGDSELHYDVDRKALRWKDTSGDVVHVSFRIRHKLEIRVEGPSAQARYLGQPIQAHEIHQHRMEATEEEMLGVPENATRADVAKARRAAAKAYHTDKYQQLGVPTRSFLDDLLKEKNSAADRKLERLERESKRTRSREPESSKHPQKRNML